VDECKPLLSGPGGGPGSGAPGGGAAAFAGFNMDSGLHMDRSFKELVWDGIGDPDGGGSATVGRYQNLC
jgi:hypothetical protein